MRIFIIGKYMTGNTKKNIKHAKEVMAKLIRAGHDVFCAHTMTAGLDRIGLDDECREMHLRWMEVCDAVFLLDEWEVSVGSRKEYQVALNRGMTIYRERNVIWDGF